MEWIKQPWPWYISGIIIVGIMTLLLFFGKSFGFSSNFRALCAACGASKYSKLFDYNWQNQIWNLLFLVGAVAGGWIASTFLSNGEPVQISQETLADLQKLGIKEHGSYLPPELFSWEALVQPKVWFLLIIGGLLVGFGTSYAGGCTSGHGISGLSNLQLPSLIAVVGFFLGGLIMTYLLFPIIF